MNRQDIVERALLIALTQRDMSGCLEEHSLMSSVCKALDESSNQMSLSVKLSGKHNLLTRYRFWNVIHDWCHVEPICSPFTKKQMRSAVAEAMLLARKELRHE
jgi:hypothetical protein